MGTDLTELKSKAVGLLLRRFCAREHLTLKQAGERAGYTPSYLSKIVRGERPLSLTALERLTDVLHLSESERASLRATAGHESPTDDLATAIPRDTFSSQIPEFERFYGRTEELDTLQRWITQEQGRVIAIYGLHGVGKTALAARLAIRLHDQFSHVLWQTLTTTTSIEAMARACLNELENTTGAEQVPHNGGTSPHPHEYLHRLLNALRARRCLLILDNFEAIAQMSAPAGTAGPEQAEYDQLIQALSDHRHESCLLVISHELPPSIASQASKSGLVHQFALQGVDEAAGRQILEEKGIADHILEARPLIKQYGGHPLALKLAGEVIFKFYGGSIEAFSRERQLLFGGVQKLLDRQFTPLSPREQHLLYWLAIEREPVELETLQKDLLPPIAKGEILSLLDSLHRRSLIEVRGSGTFGLHSLILEYVTERFVSEICQELTSGSFALCASHAILKAQAAEHIRASQTSAILAPLAERLRASLGESGAEQWVRSQLDTLRHLTAGQRAHYAAGNLLNLLVHLGSDLRGIDCSQLVVRQADLRAVELADADFSNTELATSVFAETFGGVLGLAYSPRRSLLAAATMSGEICLWNPQHGTPVARLVGHEGWVRMVAFSPDGRWLASASDDRTVRLWDIPTGELAGVFPHPDRVRAVAFSPDGRWLASGCNDALVRLWEVESGGPIRTLPGHQQRINALAFSPRGSLLASASHDHTIRLWHIPEGNVYTTFTKHQAPVRALAFTADGRWLASGSVDQRIHIWDVGTRALRRTLTAQSRIWSVAFSPDAELVVAAGEDRTIRTWEMATGREHPILIGHRDRVRTLAFSPETGLLASGSDDQTVRIWNVHGHALHMTLTGYNASIWTAAFSPDGRWLATGSEDQTIRLHELPGGQVHLRLQDHHHRVAATAISPDGRWLATGGDGQTIRIRELPSGQHIAELRQQNTSIRTLCFSPDGRWLATAGNGQVIQLWSTHDWRETCLLRNATSELTAIYTVAFSPDGCWLASVGNDGKVHLWDAERHTLARTLQGHEDHVCAVAFSPDGRWLASGGADLTIRLWDAASGTLNDVLTGHEDWVRTLCFSPDGRMLASGGDDKMVRLWGLGDQPSHRELGAHESRVWAVAYHPLDAQLLASAGEDGTLRLWNLRDEGDVVVMRNERLYERMRIRGSRGLTQAQRINLLTLGALD